MNAILTIAQYDAEWTAAVRANRHAMRGDATVLVLDRAALQPPSWGKVPMMISALAHFSRVLWVDGDAVLLRPVDFDALPDEMALADDESNGPNCGVWHITRDDAPAVLQVLAEYERFRDHIWWEQGAFRHLRLPYHRLDPQVWNALHRDERTVIWHTRLPLAGRRERVIAACRNAEGHRV